MEKQLPIKNIKAFRLVEMIFTLFIISCLLITTLWSRSLFDIQLIDEEYEIKQLITKFNYYKSKAISNNESITLLFFNNSNRVQVIEENGDKYSFKLNKGKVINIAKIQTLNFDKNGNINHFGSLILQYNSHAYRLIFHIEKGRLRFVKI